MITSLLANDYMENNVKDNLKEYTITEREANRFLFQLFIPISGVVFMLYYLLWKDQFDLDVLKGWFSSQGIDSSWKISLLFLFLTVIVIVGIILHELIHGLFWLMGSSIKNFSNIKFGILKQSFTPYCHIKVPLERNAYVIGAIAPSLILGLAPLILGLCIGDILVYFFGYLFLLSSIGDFMIISLVMKNVNKKEKY